ncbi:PilZ domain-containing protein [Saccharibacillus sp. CPCC 101409]|uniref:flagellar brake protein n=1 Tax=Saccharibacillus sp. CPCC 101409 TaxID=3058041 RepID=UPI0026717D6C|nr:PilZ domain-containing protein [Saccharibacillus sp. CPCC 101409]MDO3409592.1 PilZ domain-containing protein [Saccharibacillus sp. CPCC 101409]
MYPKTNEMLFMLPVSMEANEENEHRSRISEIEENAMLVELPIRAGRMSRLRLGEELSVYHMTEDGIKYYFTSHVLGYQDDSVPLMRISKPLPEDISKVQRRHYLRVPARVEIALQAPEFHFTALTSDLSGGGLSFVADAGHPVQVNQEISGWILLAYKSGSVDHVAFAGEVLRIKEPGSGRNTVSIRFTRVADTERQKLIRYCFERQLDFRNR